jgi:Tfp pilus assembly protein PilN
VAVHASRWFLRNGHPLVTDAVRQRRTRLVVAAAADEETVEAIARGVVEAGLVLDAIVPMGVVGLAGRDDGTHERRSGSVIERLDVANGELTAVRRPAQVTPAADDVSPVRLFDRKPILDLRPPRLAVERARRRLRAARICFGAACVLWLAAGATWSVRVSAETRALRARLDAVRPEVEVAMRLQDEIGQAEGALAVLEGARRDRSRVVDLLGALTRGLPDSAYVTSLRIASDGTVSLAGLALSAGHVVRSLAGAPGIVHPELQGPVTRERIDGVARERFALRFRWNPLEEQQ